MSVAPRRSIEPRRASRRARHERPAADRRRRVRRRSRSFVPSGWRSAASVHRAEIRILGGDRPDLVVPSLFWLRSSTPLCAGTMDQRGSLERGPSSSRSSSLITVEPDRAAASCGTIDHIERYGLTAYDAHYLALSTQLGARIADARSASWGRPRAHVDQLRSVGIVSARRRAPYEHDVTWPRYKGASAYLAKLRAEALRRRLDLGDYEASAASRSRSSWASSSAFVAP